MWVVLTVFAALMQASRNALKIQMGHSVGVVGISLARVIFAPMILVCYLLIVYAVRPGVPPVPNSDCATLIVITACLQIIATLFLVSLFQLKNYTVGAGLAQSEAIAAAMLGFMFFGTSITLLGWVGVLIGTCAVFMLSSGSIKELPSLKTLMLGLGSGVGFALASLCVRAASLRSGLPFPHSAAWVLLGVMTIQAGLLLIYLVLRDRQTLLAMWSNKRLTCLVSLTSCLCSMGWFNAMALEEVAYVKTLGQVEVFFTIMISRFWLKNRFKKQDTAGLMLIAVSAVLVMWV